jgi:hypothetical protein
LQEQKNWSNAGVEEWDYCRSSRLDYCRRKLISFRSQGSSVSVVTSLRSDPLRNLVSILGRDRDQSLLHMSIRGPGSPSHSPLFKGYRTIFPHGQT